MSVLFTRLSALWQHSQSFTHLYIPIRKHSARCIKGIQQMFVEWINEWKSPFLSPKMKYCISMFQNTSLKVKASESRSWGVALTLMRDTEALIGTYWKEKKKAKGKQKKGYLLVICYASRSVCKWVSLWSDQQKPSRKKYRAMVPCSR